MELQKCIQAYRTCKSKELSHLDVEPAQYVLCGYKTALGNYVDFEDLQNDSSKKTLKRQDGETKNSCKDEWTEGVIKRKN